MDWLLHVERLYKSVHSGVQPSMTGASKCPFRAALQSNKHAATTAVEPLVKGQGKGEEEECGVKRSTEDGNCKCAAQGLQPVGKSVCMSDVTVWCTFIHTFL